MSSITSPSIASTPLRRSRLQPFLIWGCSDFFVLFQFFLQLSSGVMIAKLMQSFGLTAFGAGVLSSAYYYIYITLQAPAGMLMDRFGPRYLLTIGSFVCAFGCYFFGISANVTIATLGRLLMGAGASFAFVGSLHIIRDWFPEDRFAFMVGIAETIGMLGTVVGAISLAEVINSVGWRSCMLFAALVLLGLSLVSWLVIRENPEKEPHQDTEKTSFSHRLRITLNNPIAWINGIYSGLLFSIVTVFVALWGIPFLMLDFHISLPLATTASTMVFLGVAIGSPAIGYYSGKFNKTKPFLIGGPLLCTLFISLILYLPSMSLAMLFTLLFLLGVACSSYVLNFDVANRIAPKHAKSTYIGFTNALCIITAPLLQPFVGYVLHILAQGHSLPSHEVYSLLDYREALSILPLSMLAAAALAFLIPEKNSNSLLVN